MKAIITLLLLITFGINAQNIHRCATNGNPDNYNYLDAKNPLQDDVTIPVVVHILHNQLSGAIQGNNISVAQIHSQIDRLNEDFGGLNPELANIPSEFTDIVAYDGVGFDFKLAELDPEGNPTSGITRTYTQKEIFRVETNDAKQSLLDGVDGWPRSTYLNLWVVPNLVTEGFNGDDTPVLGYATFPNQDLDESLDGVVIDHEHFGNNTGLSIPQNTVYYKGRTLVHEIGHFFSLKHIWGETVGCQFDDGIIDTPSQNGPYYNCQNSIQSSCGSSDMHINFMDYGDDICIYAFTNGQKERMLQALNNHPTRVDLLTAGEDAFFTCTAKSGNVLSPGTFEICYDDQTENLNIFNGNNNEVYQNIWAVCEPSGLMLNLYNGNPVSFSGYEAGYYGVTVINVVEWEIENVEALFETQIWTVTGFKEALSVTGICADIQQFGYPIFTLLEYGSSPDCPAFSLDVINVEYQLKTFQKGFSLNLLQQNFKIGKLFNVKGQQIQQSNYSNQFNAQNLHTGIYIIHLEFENGENWIKKVVIN